MQKIIKDTHSLRWQNETLEMLPKIKKTCSSLDINFNSMINNAVRQWYEENKHKVK
jgi:hypothetical protein